MRRGMRRIFRFWEDGGVVGRTAHPTNSGAESRRSRRAIASVDRAGDFLGKSAERGPPARVGDFDGALAVGFRWEGLGRDKVLPLGGPDRHGSAGCRS